MGRVVNAGVAELCDTVERLGYRLDKEAVRRTVAFYLARTSHGSTLGRLVCAWVTARADRTRSWTLFTQALDSDLADIQGGTTRDGIHLGAMAGTVDMLLRCYTGLETRDGLLWLHPTLPPELGHAEFATKAGSTRPAQHAPRSPGTPLPATGSPAAARNRLNSTSGRIRTAWRRGPTTISTPTSVAGSAVAAGCGRRAASWPAARTPPSPPRFGSVCLPEHGGGPVASCPPR